MKGRPLRGGDMSLRFALQVRAVASMKGRLLRGGDRRGGRDRPVGPGGASMKGRPLRGGDRLGGAIRVVEVVPR